MAAPKHTASATQMPMFLPESDWEAPRIEDLPDDWGAAKRIGIDCETHDAHLKTMGIGVRRGGYVVGVSFAIEDGPKHYVPLRHQGGGNVEDPDQYLRYFRDQSRRFRGTYVGANLSYDLDYLMEEGMEFGDDVDFKDVQIADPLINELQDSYSLQAISERHRMPGKDQELLDEAAVAYSVDPKAGLWRLPARFVGPYAEQDAELPLRLLRRQERAIEREELEDIWRLECSVLPVLVRMRRRGVRIDHSRLEEVEDWSLREEAKALGEVHRLSGVRIAVGDVWKPGAVVPLMEYFQIPLTRTPTGKVSVRKDILEEIDDPAAVALGRARKVNKLRTTFASSVRRYETNGRIHCSMNQIAIDREDGRGSKGVRYGRLSSDNPNMQQQPSRDDFANFWRSIYLPEDGQLWSSTDLSQQEPRWTTHFAAVMNLPGARDAAQAYHDDPHIDNHTFMAEITGLDRKYAKLIYLGLCYGEGGAKLCRDLGLPTQWAVAVGSGRERRVTYYDSAHEAESQRMEHLDQKCFVWETAGEEGRAILDKFDNRAPFIKRLANKAKQRVSQVGYIRTPWGRRLNFKRGRAGEYEQDHKALNRIIQGTSADQMKRAMVEVERAGHYMMLQVHDELCCSVRSREEAREIADIMSRVADEVGALVPFRVDVEVGVNWGAAE